MTEEPKIKLLEFKKTYTSLTKSKFEEDELLYNLGLIVLSMKEFDNFMVKVKRVNKPTRSGTGVTYEKIKTIEEAESYASHLVKKFEKQYDLFVESQKNNH